MPRYSRLRPVNSIKNISEVSSIIAATTDTIALTVSKSVDAPAVSNSNEVSNGSTINSIYLSVYVIAEGGEVANEVPLVDWYIWKNNGNQATGSEIPTPGATGTDELKRYILHQEKGLAGGGDASLAGVPMIFKGVIKLPRTFRRQAINDRIQVMVRTTFASKICIQAIYKWYK